MPVVVRTIMDGILHLFSDPECKQDLKGPIPQIKEETCETVSGQEPRCVFYKGKMTLTIPVPVLPSVDVPLLLYQRGCRHFKPANVPASGWHDSQNINEDKTVIKQILDKTSSTLSGYNVAKFEGQMQLCADTYCKDVSGVSKGHAFSTILFLIFVLFASLHNLS